MPAKGFTHESTYNESKEWYTPRYIFEALKIPFDLDPCSPGSDIVSWIPVLNHLTVKENGLLSKWSGNVFMNPPYGMDTPDWMDRLVSHGRGIALVFCRPDTKWFQKYIPRADAICFVAGRIGFVPAEKADLYNKNLWTPKGGCGAASMLVAFGKENAEALFHSELGFTLPVIKHTEMFRDMQRFADDKCFVQDATDIPYENPPRNVESRQDLFV